MRFHKYHALGNDYLVLDPLDGDLPDPAGIRKICHRNFGLGSDGILFGPLPAKNANFGLRILNPDGSEAEKSGNGLRIFCRYLRDQGKAGTDSFTIETLGGVVTCRINPDASLINVGMGEVSFDAARIPVPSVTGEVINQTLIIDHEPLTYCAATVGNPHCVIPVKKADPDLAHRLGPRIETHPNFPNRTNVQFLEIIDRNTIRIEIWERGAGYTLASGSSSSAAAAVAHRLGLVDADITVLMPGGTIGIRISDSYEIEMSGPATPVGTFQMAPEVLSQNLP